MYLTAVLVTLRWNGGDQSAYTPEARTAWAAKFDAAALQDNHAPGRAVVAAGDHAPRATRSARQPADPERLQAALWSVLADKGTEHLARFDAEVREWAAHVGFENNLGKAMIERMIELGPRLRDMSPKIERG